VRSSWRAQLDPGEDDAPDRSAVHELGDPRAVREELAPPRPERGENPAVAQELESQPVASEPFCHVAAVDEAQL
jgi:hypothetical protein